MKDRLVRICGFSVSRIVGSRVQVYEVCGLGYQVSRIVGIGWL